jgi:hypothetical protein
MVRTIAAVTSAGHADTPSATTPVVGGEQHHPPRAGDGRERSLDAAQLGRQVFQPAEAAGRFGP